MLSKEEKNMLKRQEREFKAKQKEHREELKEIEEDRKKNADGRRMNRKLQQHTPKKKKQKTNQKEILSVFPIRDYQEDFFVTGEKEIIDIFQIQGRSYYDASDEDVERLVYDCDHFLQKYSADFKFISLNYPTNTEAQQAFLNAKLQQPELAPFEEIITQKIDALKDLEQTTTEREAFIMVFAKNKGEYEQLCMLLQKSGSYQFKTISREKKENIIFQLNNMNKRISVKN